MKLDFYIGVLVFFLLRLFNISGQNYIIRMKTIQNKLSELLDQVPNAVVIALIHKNPNLALSAISVFFYQRVFDIPIMIEIISD